MDKQSNSLCCQRKIGLRSVMTVKLTDKHKQSADWILRNLHGYILHSHGSNFSKSMKGLLLYSNTSRNKEQRIRHTAGQLICQENC